MSRSFQHDGLQITVLPSAGRLFEAMFQDNGRAFLASPAIYRTYSQEIRLFLGKLWRNAFSHGHLIKVKLSEELKQASH